MAIITITGTPGSGKSTLAKLLAKRLGYKHYSMGDFQRRIATEQGWTINELNEKNATGEYDSDSRIDEYQTELGKKEDGFVLDSRLAFHFIPKSVKLFVDATEEERAKRLMRRGSSSDQAESVEHAAKLNSERTGYENNRFKKLYGVEPSALENYDLVLDSTTTNAEELVRQVLEKFPELTQ